jgi:mono/diheme cytochrome c family protein
MKHGDKSILFIASLAFIIVLRSTACALAAQVGSVEEGHRFARELCSQCHLLGEETGRSTYEQATPFREVAKTPGMTSAALKLILVTPHRHMPALAIRGQEADSIVAYIMSLKRRD